MRYLKVLLNLILLSLLCFTLPKGAAYAQQSTPSADDVNRIARDLFCPVCDNVPLDECATPVCEQWRDLIRQQLAEGWSDEEIKDYFVAQYGDRVLGLPPRQGLHWLLYILPPLGVLIGAGLLLTKLRRTPQQEPTLIEEARDPYREQVERDLENLDG